MWSNYGWSIFCWSGEEFEAVSLVRSTFPGRVFSSWVSASDSGFEFTGDFEAGWSTETLALNSLGISHQITEGRARRDLRLSFSPSETVKGTTSSSGPATYIMHVCVPSFVNYVVIYCLPRRVSSCTPEREHARRLRKRTHGFLRIFKNPFPDRCNLMNRQSERVSVFFCVYCLTPQSSVD